MCNHDPLFTTDGRCAKCYPRRYARIIMVQHIDGTIEVDSRIALTPERIADVTPLVDETMEKWHEYLAGMSDDEIALMNEMTRETAHDDTKDDAMGRLW